MAFDLSSAQPVDQSAAPNGFDLSSATPVGAPAAPKFGNFEVLPGGKRVPVGSPEAIAAHGPSADSGFWQNTLEGVGKFDTDAMLAAKQMWAQVTGGDPTKVTDPFTGQTSSEKRTTDQPLASTWGGKVGQVAGAVPLAFLPGANSYAGAAAIGGGLGALQPTVGDESRGLNTGVGAGLGLLGKYGGDKVSSWITQRAAQPLMGFTPKSADKILAQAVGSNASKLDSMALGTRSKELSDIFQTGRNAATNVDLSPTPAVLDGISNDINPSARAAFEGNPNVMDLMSHATGKGQVNGQMLGKISTGLRQDASSALNSEGGNREVGLALNKLRDHVEDMITSSIPDPAVQAAYSAARPQYGLLQDVRYNPSVLNAATGRSNMENLGKFLQRNSSSYTSGAENPLFSAARWGQAGGGAKGMPSFSLATPWNLPLYGLTHNPVARATGGLLSRGLRPAASALPGTTRGLLLEAPSVGESYFGNR